MENQQIQEQMKQSFEKGLNRHGYAFQYAVLKVARDMCDFGSEWIFEASEFPVEVKGTPTKIDFILRHSRAPWFYLLGECKRANPALSNWCFARAPYIHRDRDEGVDPFVVEKIIQPQGGDSLRGTAHNLKKISDAYHIAFETKTDQKGDVSSGRGAIEEAASQVSRGLSGLVEFFSAHPLALSTQKQALLLPVIFTTANLWASRVDLRKADPETGNVSLEREGADKKGWVCYQYHLSPGIKHDHVAESKPGPIGEIMDQEFVRTIPIVCPLGIDQFLRATSALV